MAKHPAQSILYRLIEAGQHAHRALLAPLLDRGLEAGDDAVLLLLGDDAGAGETALAAATGRDAAALQPRLDRLLARDLVCRRAIGPLLDPGLALTERGKRLVVVLQSNAAQVEEHLLAELSPRRRKRFSRTLKRFVTLLRR